MIMVTVHNINMAKKDTISIGFEVLNLEFSPVKGPEGNIEYLLYIQNVQNEPMSAPLEGIARVVAESAQALSHR